MAADILSSSISIASVAHRKQFHCAIKNVNESCSDWYYRLLALSRSCEFGEATNAFILDKFIFGLEDYQIDRLCMGLDVITLVKSMYLLNESSFNGQQENQLADLSELISSSIKVEIGEGDVQTDLKKEPRQCAALNSNADKLVIYVFLGLCKLIDN